MTILTSLTKEESLRENKALLKYYFFYSAH